jgi:hypothetical protein
MMGSVMQTVATRQAKGARAVAAALPHAGFHDPLPGVATGRPARPPRSERLAWPLAAVAILGTSALLWLGILIAARAVLG